jgi:hypothetical protein
LDVLRDAFGERLRHRQLMGALDGSTAFRKAVLDLSAEPTPVNVRRYLAASRLLERDAARLAPPVKKESDR